MTPDTAAIRARVEKATPGPWVTREPLHTWIDSTGCCDRGAMHIADVRGWGHLTGKGSGAHAMPEAPAIAIQEANAAFIAAARTDVPALCDEIDRLRAELASAREALTKITELETRIGHPVYAAFEAQRVARDALRAAAQKEKAG